jgi:hypothetical protein
MAWNQWAWYPTSPEKIGLHWRASPRNSMIKHAIEVHTMQLSDGMEPVGMVSNFPGKNRLALRCLCGIWNSYSTHFARAYSGTDGSYKDGHGTAAFRLQNDHGDQITGCNITPGLQEHQSAYHSDLGGIVGILVLLDLLQQHYDLRIQQFVITCDCCNGAGLKSLTYHRPPTANNDNYDLLTKAYKIKTKATIDTVYQWVEGHQAHQKMATCSPISQ